ncbi:molybdenum ABC transporter ATP-binding protein, partial [Salmonella enterica]|nr:molybdenum ABC transporter ATP-binding protein [Salmonella enterica]
MIIDVQHVTWKRGPITLLNDVSWRVNEGEHWALLGL